MRGTGTKDAKPWGGLAFFARRTIELKAVAIAAFTRADEYFDVWRICTTCGNRSDDYACEKCATATEIIRADTEFPGRLHRGDLLLGHYEVHDLVGVGGMGAVYRGEQRLTQQKVAIKVLWRDLASEPLEVKRFSREARAASLLAHPNSVRVFDFGSDDKSKSLFIIMEFLAGQKLSDVLRLTPMLDPSRVVHICTQVCKALEEAHRKGVVHRDIKPDNIFLQDVAGEQDFAKVLDFGLAKFVTGAYERDQLTRTGYVVGSPEYMAPEQASGGEVGPPADIYSLGIVLYECLTGQLPFDAQTTAEVLRKHILEGPPRLIGVTDGTENIPPALEEVVLRCLDKEPSARPASADALRIQLLVACDRRRLNVAPNLPSPTPVEAPTSVEETRGLSESSRQSAIEERETVRMDSPVSTEARELLFEPTPREALPIPAATSAPPRPPRPISDVVRALTEEPTDRSDRDRVQAPGAVHATVTRALPPSEERALPPLSDSLDIEDRTFVDPRARPGSAGLLDGPAQHAKRPAWIYVAAAICICGLAVAALWLKAR